MFTAGQTIDTPTLPQLFTQFKIALGRMVFIRMKGGMVFVMLALFGSCVYTGTFFFLNLIEESEGMSDNENTSRIFSLLSMHFLSARSRSQPTRNYAIRSMPLSHNS